MLQKKTNTFW